MRTTWRLAIAGAFFIFWLLVLLAGADRPPPAGFLWVVLLDLIAAALVYLRLPEYARWASDSWWRHLPRVIAEGALAGLCFALVPMVVSTGEPSITPPNAAAIGVWVAVIAAVGLFNTVALYGALLFAVTRARSARRPS